MSIRPIGNSLSIRIAPSVPSGSPTRPENNAGPANNSRADLLRARDELLRVYDALQSLAELMDVRTSFTVDYPDARSASSLNLDLSTTAATLYSSEAINASPRSFTPFGPAWDLGSSALITVGGEYDGSYGSGPLSFEVRRAGVRGVDNLQIRAYEPDGSRINTFTVRANHPLDRQYNLDNGMYFTVGAGSLIANDNAEIQISDSVGSVFNPNLPFNGVRNNNPNFQYYENNPLAPVTNGSFQLNGTNITVNASDTLSAVIDRINQSAAGVTASYNDVTEQIEFTQNSTGSS
ncbi:MAG: flagellin hook IN motif-containing protein, partial [Woeseia sp.]